MEEIGTVREFRNPFFYYSIHYGLEAKGAFKKRGEFLSFGNAKNFMKTWVVDMKNEKLPVGQASRLSELSWRRHLSHYLL